MNPFYYQQEAPIEACIPRPSESAVIVSAAKNHSRLRLEGERKVGKSTIVVNSLVGHVGLVKADLSAVKDIGDVCDRIQRGLTKMLEGDSKLRQLMRSLTNREPSFATALNLGPKGSFGFSLSLPKEKAEATNADERRLAAVLDGINKIAASRPVALFLDEFQDVLNMADGDKILWRLRAIMAENRNLAYFFAGSIRTTMQKAFDLHHDSAFVKETIRLELRPIPKEIMWPWLGKRFHSGERTLEPVMVEKWWELTRGLPGDVQRIGHALWEASKPRDLVGLGHLDQALRNIVRDDYSFNISILRNLTKNQYTTLVYLALAGGRSPTSDEAQRQTRLSSGSLGSSVNSLEQAQIIYRNLDDELVFSDNFLKCHLLYWQEEKKALPQILAQEESVPKKAKRRR